MSKNRGAKRLFNTFIIIFPLVFFFILFILILIARSNNGIALTNGSSSSSIQSSSSKSAPSIAVGEPNPAQPLTASGYFNYTQGSSLEGFQNVLFFYSNNCSDCNTINKNLISSKDVIPSNLAVYKVDFDTETSLKQKYEITSAGSFVQVDQEGNLIKKWNNTLDLSSILSQLK